MLRVIPAVVAALAASAGAQTAPTAFTYQGALREAGTPVSASVQMTFRMFDAATGGTQVGPAISRADVAVDEGLFTQALDFGTLDTGRRALWLDVTVNGFALAQRQAITASPYALQTRGIHVDDDGRVGIGTNTPNAELEVERDGAALRVHSTDPFAPAQVEIMGDVGSPLGGVFGRIAFMDTTASEIFGLQHDEAFAQTYLTIRSALEPAGIVRIRDDGLIAIGDIPSIAPVHVTDRDIGLFNDAMLNETLALEDNDAVLGIYSSNTGTFGSALVFGESVANELNDKWAFVRTTTNTDPELRVTWGFNANYAQNNTAVTFVPGGIKFRNGSVQSWAAVTDSDDESTTEVFSVSGTKYAEGIEVTIDQFGQRVLVTGFFEVQVLNDNGLSYQLVYREVGTGGPFLGAATERRLGTRDWSSAEFRSAGQTAVITSLSPGTYEIRFRISGFVGDDTPTNFLGADMSAIVF
jgi:hypothetical protein